MKRKSFNWYLLAFIIAMGAEFAIIKFALEVVELSSLPAPVNPEDRPFHIGIVISLMAHAVLIIGLGFILKYRTVLNNRARIGFIFSAMLTPFIIGVVLVYCLRLLNVWLPLAVCGVLTLTFWILIKYSTSNDGPDKDDDGGEEEEEE